MKLLNTWSTKLKLAAGLRTPPCVLQIEILLYGWSKKIITEGGYG